MLADKVVTALKLGGVLVEGDEEHSATTLRSHDGGPSKKYNPAAEPPLAKLTNNLVLVAYPVVEPVVEGESVVHTTVLYTVYFVTGAFALGGTESKGARCVSSREYVGAHEDTPAKILKLPCAAESSKLKVEDTLVLKHVLALEKKGLEVLDANVLNHFKAGDYVVLLLRDITVVHAQQVDLVLYTVDLLSLVVSPLNLLASEGNTGRVGSKVLCSVAHEGTPSASNIKVIISGLHARVAAYEVHLAVLCNLEGFVLGLEDSRGVNHTGAEKVVVKVVRAVIYITNFSRVSSLRVVDELSGELEQKELEVLGGKAKAEYLVPLPEELHGLDLDVDLVLQVVVHKDSNGDLLSGPSGLELGVGDVKVLAPVASLIGLVLVREDHKTKTEAYYGNHGDGHGESNELEYSATKDLGEEERRQEAQERYNRSYVLEQEEDKVEPMATTYVLLVGRENPR
mmetsp:Transcript_7819/g.13803  ORF Transcript_7819/g.13803 Transcript_7819/m.13803 type:complete len:455 (-) Transcript_7819:75-1439(-)